MIKGSCIAFAANISTYYYDGYYTYTLHNKNIVYHNSAFIHDVHAHIVHMHISSILFSVIQDENKIDKYEILSKIK